MLVILSFSLGLLSCRQQKKSVTESNEPTRKEIPEPPENQNRGQVLLDKCLLAHGGLDRWKSYEGLEYQLNSNGKEVYQITQLKDRRAYLKSKSYEVGFDGKVAWALPDASEVPGESAVFYYNLDFYFIGIPFLLKDPGVKATYAGKATINGQPYESLKITFNPGVGFTPEDVYHLYIEPETFMLRILTYSVAYFNRENAPVNSAKLYTNYIYVDGLLMPTTMENFEWKDGAMGESKNYVRHFSEFRFLKQIPDETLFQVPEGAVIEELTQ